MSALPIVPENLMDDKAAAEKLGLSPSTLRSWRCRGVGPAFVKLGRGKKAAVRYHPRDLDRFIDHGRHVSSSSVRAASEE
jgi:hypothetical protein